MLWQAMSNVTFRMPGGYAVFRNAAGKATFDGTPSLVQEVLAECQMGVHLHLEPSIIRAELRSWHASRAVVPESAPGATCATRLFTSAYGPPNSENGVRIWNT
jgi:hypothetical protein